ncbi:MAG: ATP-dependent sacrificial sulfur transferase LarE [Alphaproteobacteria bacterium]|nr:ATP-dependent sacrificial sulfur transferase LarE [Alphaproteobacteria bacterium]
MTPDLAAKTERLTALIESYGSVIVAYSGGIDSSLVAYVAAERLGARALAVTSGSASLKRSDLALAETLAGRWGLRHRVIVTDELDKADYRANPVNRCFHCKTSLYDALAVIAREEGIEHVLNGTNLDDLGDHRPGLVAAEEHGVKSPLVEAGFTKADIRALAHALGLENAAKPQSACLSSRFPYGTAIDPEKLARVEAAEAVLESLGFSQFRVRHHEDIARLELLPEDLPRALAAREELYRRVKACGYRFVALDLAGFRSGSLNEGVVTLVNRVG